MSMVTLDRVDGVATIRLTRAGKLNALSSALIDELRMALIEASNSNASVVLLGGEGTSFCAGAEMTELGTDAETGRRFLERVTGVLSLLRHFKKPVVAAVQGYAVGGGAEIALEADLRVVATDVVIRFPDVAIGSTPASTFQLVRLVGASVAARMVFLQEDLTATWAERLGLAARVVEPEDIWEEGLLLAQRVARFSPLSLGLAKQSLRLAATADAQTDLDVNLESMVQCFASPAQQQAIKEFLARR